MIIYLFIYLPTQQHQLFVHFSMIFKPRQTSEIVLVLLSSDLTLGWTWSLLAPPSPDECLSPVSD